MIRSRAAATAICMVVAMLLPLAPAAHASQPPSAAAAVPVGASKYVAVPPTRLADTRPTASGYGGFTMVNGSTMRVSIIGRPGVPAGATAAVLNVAMIEPASAGYATVYPGGEGIPATSSLNADQPGRVIANMVHVKIGANGAADIYMSTSMKMVVDLVGVYTPVASATKDGRLVTLAGGALRVFDTRNQGYPVGPGLTTSVDLAPAGIPGNASAVVVTVTAVTANTGFWSAFPANQSFSGTSTLNLDQGGQTRAAQAIVKLAGSPRINVYTETGGHLLVDVVGYFTGTDAAASTDGLFVPASPLRMLDTRPLRTLPPWSGSTYEFPLGNPGSLTIAAAALNITATSPWDKGYVTAYPAGVSRPLSSNLNISAVPQTIANHAIVRVSTRGAALFTQGGSHLIADVAGWYLGIPSSATQPAPANPNFSPNSAVAVHVGKIGVFVGIKAGGGNLNAIADQGYAATWSDINTVAAPGNLMLFGHRTEGSAPFRYLNLLKPGDTFSIVGSDGHWYNYEVMDIGVSTPSYSQIQSYANPFGLATAQLVACSRIDGSATSLSYRIAVTGRLVSVD